MEKNNLEFRRTYNSRFIVEHYDINNVKHDIYIEADNTGIYKVTQIDFKDVSRIKILEHEGQNLGIFKNEEKEVSNNG